MKFWTPEEDQILRDNFYDCSWDELYKLLPGRGHESLRSRARRMGLTRGRGHMKTHWAAAEDKVLRDMYYDGVASDIREALPGRTWHGIVSRARRLGLQRKFVNANHEKAKRSTNKIVLDFVVQYHREYGYGPIRAEVADGTGLAHTTVTDCVSRMTERGFFVHQHGRTRTIGLAPALRRKIAEHERSLRDRVKTGAAA